MLYQVSYGPGKWGRITAMTYIEASSPSIAFSKAKAQAQPREVVQEVVPIPVVGTSEDLGSL